MQCRRALNRLPLCGSQLSARKAAILITIFQGTEMTKGHFCTSPKLQVHQSGGQGYAGLGRRGGGLGGEEQTGQRRPAL